LSGWDKLKERCTFLKETKMNKKIMLLGLLVAIMSVSALGAGFMGTPTAELKKGQWNAGYNYMYSDMDLEKTKMTYTENEYDAGGDLVDTETGIWHMKIKDFKTQRHYATIGYGVEDWWEVYLQLGIADVKAKVRDADEPEDDWEGLNFDNNFAWGWGTRLTFYEQENIRWGTSIQMNWLDTSWDTKGIEEEEETVTYKNQIDIDTYDILIALGPTADMGGWKLYGGPFFYYLSGDMDVKGTETWADGSETWKVSCDLKADSNFGGFVGAQFALSENIDMTTEFSFTGDSWAFGTGIACRF